MGPPKMTVLEEEIEIFFVLYTSLEQLCQLYLENTTILSDIQNALPVKEHTCWVCEKVQ